MASRRASLSLRLAILAAACGLGVGAAASGAAAQPNDPDGNNGTVKIDNVPVDDSPANMPHVTCPFAVQFFGFDEGQTADIRLAAHPPSGSSSQTVAALNNVVVSDDPAGGAGNDVDNSFVFTADDLDLSGLEEHPQQGFHIKLFVTSEGLPGDGKKHKVFWLKCAKPSPTPTPTKTVSPSPTQTTKPPTAAPTKTSPGALPVTGTGNWIGGIAGFGLALVAGGTGLMLIRRRRDDLNITG